MEFQNVQEAWKQNLIQLTIWLPNTLEERYFIEKEYNRISKDLTRKVMAVKNNQDKIALFVDDLSKDSIF